MLDFKNCNFNRRYVERVNMRHSKISWKSVKLLLRYEIFRYFKNGDYPPSWICYEHVWTTREEYSVTFITVPK